MKQFFMVPALVMAMSATAQAEDFVPNNQWGALLGAALTFGGDSIVKYQVAYDDGDTSKEDIKAGESMLVYGGGYFQYNLTPTRSYGLQVDIAYFFNNLSADNGDVSLTRYPFEIIPYAKFDKIRLGMGLAQHNQVKLKDDAVLNMTADFEDANGLIIIAEYLLTEKVAVGLRYVDIDYDLDLGYTTLSYDASHIGISITGLF